MKEKQSLVDDGLIKIAGDTPTMRLFSLLELIATQDRQFSLQDLVDSTDLPKPTVHRMLQQLEGSEMLIRDTDGRHYGIEAAYVGWQKIYFLTTPVMAPDMLCFAPWVMS